MKDMLGRKLVQSREDALALVLSAIHLRTTKVFRCRIEDALGLVCSDAILAAEDLPAFARSTVDGYAVRAEDTFGASESIPAYMTVVGEILMGRQAGSLGERGSAAKIPTGGMLPAGADAVVMFEHVQLASESLIEVSRPAAPFENVIRAGEDIRQGEVAVERGCRFRPQDIGACAGLGITEVSVHTRPVVAIISTGDEIVPAEEQPGPGHIRDTNSFVIAGMVANAGGIPVRKGIVCDDYDAIRAIIESSLTESDIVVVSGGTSVGTKDMLARIIEDIGNPGILFHGIALKPGKPLIGGIIRGIPIFGLPGHPAAVSLCCNLFLRPVMSQLSGAGERGLIRDSRIVRARLSRNIRSDQGREEHVRAMLEERDDGLWAVPILGKSGLIRTLVQADGTFMVPLGRNGIAQGEYVDVFLF